MGLSQESGLHGPPAALGLQVLLKHAPVYEH